MNYGLYGIRRDSVISVLLGLGRRVKLQDITEPPWTLLTSILVNFKPWLHLIKTLG
jgi:hypothetical protein